MHSSQSMHKLDIYLNAGYGAACKVHPRGEMLMCVSVAPAKFFGTKLAVWPAEHPETGARINVLAYQNTPTNGTFGPNAMVLHFPAQMPMSQTNFVDASGDRTLVQDMVNAIRPRRKLLGADSLPRAFGVSVFEHDIYTVVLAGSARDVPHALELVPEYKRPTVDHAMFDWYGRQFPRWSIALCCFDSRQATEAAPLLVWYEPMVTDRLHLPAVDCHTGDTPKLRSMVPVDHWVLVGSQEPKAGFTEVDYSAEAVNPFIAAVRPSYVAGRQFSGSMPNADFFVRAGEAQVQRGMLFS